MATIHPTVVREHIISILKPDKIPVQRPHTVSLRTPEPVKVAEINPLKALSKTLAVIPKMPKNPAGVKFSG